jgi:hypothetical protein
MSAFLDALAAAGPAPDRAGKMDLYGQFVGSWDLDVTEFRDDGTTRRRPGEWHFGWVLEGRAVQDVWCVPPRGQRAGDAVANSNRYGTTLRVYDPHTDAWRIQWTEPVGQAYLSMIGTAEGDDIVQFGRNAAGERTRWGFYEIMPDSFLWVGETSADEGASWKRVVEFRARRR